MSTAFLEDAVQRAEKSNDRGEFWAYHFPGTAIGSCDFQELHEGFLLESGLMYETPMAEKAMHYMEKHPDAGVSIRFMYRNQTKDGVYLPPGAIIERSLLPPGKEAFPWSGITLKEFQTMDKTLNEQKRKALAEMIGEDEAKQVLESLEAGSDALKEAGVRFKEFKAPDQETAEPDETLKESDEVKKEDTPAEDFEFVLSAVALDSIAAKVNERFMPAFKELVQPLIDQNAELRTVVKAMSEDLAHFAEAEETRIAEKVADLPKATIRRIVRPTRAKAKEDAGDGDETGDKTDLIQSGLDTLYS